MKFESSATGGETVFPWYINRRYGTLLVGSTLSNFGDSIFEWTLVLWAANVFGTSGGLAGLGRDHRLGRADHPVRAGSPARWSISGGTSCVSPSSPRS